jgi:hypothetical protein
MRSAGAGLPEGTGQGALAGPAAAAAGNVLFGVESPLPAVL